MPKVKRTILFFISFLITLECIGSEFKIIKTKNGSEYGFKQGDKGKPLVLVLTTDINSSLSSKYARIEESLSKSGFSTASVDVTCHGKDLPTNKKNELKCWVDRITKSEIDIFSSMIISASDAITDIQSKKLVSAGSVVVIGVSRGGYAALRVARADKRATYLVLLSPVTNLHHLSEFKGISINDKIYDLVRDLKELSSKNIFLQIGQSDMRVSTDEALRFMNNLVLARPNQAVNITVLISPILGHGVAQEDIAQHWLASQLQKQKPNLIKAP